MIKKEGARKGQNNGGVRSLADVQARCRMDSETGCWMWAGAMSTGRSGATPVGWVPASQRILTMPRFVHSLKSDTAPGIVWRSCLRDRCCNPNHLIAGSRKEWGAWMQGKGVLRNDPVRAAKNRQTRRAGSPRMTVEIAQWVRESTQTGREVSAALGLSETGVSRIRLCKTWADSVPVASVWGLAANVSRRRERA